jgi:hypothetical protein
MYKKLGRMEAARGDLKVAKTEGAIEPGDTGDITQE